MNEQKKLKNQADSPQLVSRGSEFNITRLKNAWNKVHGFNTYAAPVLRELGGLDEDFSKNLDLSKERLYALYLVNLLSKAKNELEREQLRQGAYKRFEEYYESKQDLLNRVECNFDERTLRTIRYDKKSKEFTMDGEAWLAEDFVYATTPEEKKVLASMNAVIEALNSFDWNRTEFRKVFRLQDGKFRIWDNLPRELWEQLVRTYKG